MTVSRRRFLAIAATALVGGTAHAETHRMRFRALGADATLTLPGPMDTARRTAQAVRSEIARIERAFSLWNPDSELSRLNRDGRLDLPSATFLRLAAMAMRVSDCSGGTFDVTVQPVWQGLASGHEPDYADIGWRDMEVTPSHARFARPGMAATFNGIAQGYAADRAIQVLRRRGYRNVLADLGEFNGVGVRPEGGRWRIGVAHPVTDSVVAEIALAGTAMAVATSAPRGTVIRGQPHIVDPLRRPGPRWASVTIRTTTAAAADAFSTAIAAAPIGETKDLLRHSRAVEAVLIPENGDPVHWRL